MSQARAVALEALKILRVRGVHDVVDRLEVRLPAEGREGELEGCDTVARAAIGELELRGLSAIATGLRLKLGTLAAVEVPPPAPVAPKAKKPAAPAEG